MTRSCVFTTAVADLAEWSKPRYLGGMSRWISHDLYAHIPECHGYMALSIAFAQFVAVKCDADPFDQERLAADLRESSCVQEVLRWFIRMLQSGDLRSVSRALGGGPVTNLSVSHWHADDVIDRFITSQYNRTDPFMANAKSDSWIFVKEDDVSKIWADHFETTIGKFVTKPYKKTRLSPSPQGNFPSDSMMLGLPAVEDAVGLGRSTIYKLIDEGRFPAQVKVGNRSLWRRVDIADWTERAGTSKEND